MIKWPCFLGVDTPNRDQLIASHRNVKQIQRTIQSDYLGFLSLQGLINCCGEQNHFCTGCFDGRYPIKVPKEYK
jgi:amidophosphoribosyltransferase